MDYCRSACWGHPLIGYADKTAELFILISYGFRVRSSILLILTISVQTISLFMVDLLPIKTKNKRKGANLNERLLFLHILGAVIFLGILSLPPFWKIRADIKRDPRVIHHTGKTFMLADFIHLTLPGLILIIVSGF